MGCMDACAPCLGQPPVGLVDDDDMLVPCGIVVGNGGSAVGRTIIDQYNLQVSECLVEHAVDASSQGRLGVVDGYDDRYGRCGHYLVFSL